MKKVFACVLLLICAYVSDAQQNSSVKADSTKPLVVGKVMYIKSAVLGEERDLYIYLPQDYKTNDTTKYPVVYLLDGSLDDDFMNVAGQYHFGSYPWVGRVPESIIVGIANTNRVRDFTFPTTIKKEEDKFTTSGGSGKFISFMERELQPFIEKNFRVNSSKTIIGESLGGLLATQILFTKPDLFSRYIIISPSLWWNDGSLLKDSITHFPMHKTLVYIGVGKEGVVTFTQDPHVQEVDANVLADKLSRLKDSNITVHFDYFPAETHATISEQALYNALRWMANPVGE